MDNYYQLVQVLDFSVGPENELRELRIELYHGTHARNVYRVRVFEYLEQDFLIVTNQDEGADQSNEHFVVERSWYWLSSLWRKEFSATTDQEAMQVVIEDVRNAAQGRFVENGS